MSWLLEERGSGRREAAMAITPPSDDDIAAIADRYGLGLSQRDVAEFRGLIASALTSYDVVERLHAARLPAPPERAWRRPAPGENDLGAWYVTTDIRGAEDGP